MKIIRLEPVFNMKAGKLPVGRTRFYEDYVLRSPSDPYVPGTKVRRVKLINLGPKARGVDEAEIDRVNTELAAEPYVPWKPIAGKVAAQSPKHVSKHKRRG